jgi:23S rRNA (guanosine2251-2'-O)-methyltransferase
MKFILYLKPRSKMRKLLITELNRKNSSEFEHSEKWKVRIVLDNVRSLHNIGSVFRTADAFKAERIDLCGICATPPNREIHKSALGAEETMSWKYFEHTTQALEESKKEGYEIWLVEQTDKSTSLDSITQIPEKLVLVFGNEVNGVSDTALTYADAAVEIPQFGTKHSFNISVCAGIVLYQMYRLHPTVFPYE